ncbi:hypothetical protein [Arenicella xantha]|uniref:Uncharacterized protein n=1 Tax=Arenicella xantha TaxID=644221 RepID=A0A395JJU4_9GAMM|nr:hypothetical protein [Arenicella xantha]RBP51053.1 hypothetical protein DFR28_102472 [Arenicella xantha]
MQKSIFIPIAAITVMFSTLISVSNTASANDMSAQLADTKPLVTHTINPQHGKPGASVALTYQVPETISAGETINVNLAFSAQKTQGQLQVKLNADEGMVLLNSQSFSLNLPTTPSSNVDVVLGTPTNGLYYLNVSVREFDIHGKGLMGRSFSVPIQVGMPKPQVEHKNAPKDKENIIEMPAERF